MASLYWVGGTGTWDNTAGSKWATTSGGAGGAAVPTSADDVFFDANSGANTITLQTTPNIRSLTCTGFTGTLTDPFGFEIRPYGNVILSSGMTWAGYPTGSGGSGFNFQASGTFAQNGATLTSAALTIQAGVTVTLGSDVTIAKTIILDGTLDCAGYNFTSSTTTALNAAINGTLKVGSGTASFTKLDSVGASSTIDFGSGTLALTGTGTSTIPAGCTIVPGTGTLKVTNSSTSTKTLSLGGKTYPNLWVATGNTGTTTITGSNTFADIKLTNPSGATLFTAGTTQTATSLTVAGSAGNLVPFRSATAGTRAMISIGSGSVNVDYANIKDMAFTGGATFSATRSTNGGNNTGITFVAPAIAAGGMMRRFPHVRM